MKTQGRQSPTPAVLHILLALSTEERHGYGIMKQVEPESQGKVKMGPGTLYGSLGRMMDAGLIRESDKKVDPAMDDERRIYYTLTGLGAEGARGRGGPIPRRRRGRPGEADLAERLRRWHLIGPFADIGAGTPGCFASIRGHSRIASASRWRRPSPI